MNTLLSKQPIFTFNTFGSMDEGSGSSNTFKELHESTQKEKIQEVYYYKKISFNFNKLFIVNKKFIGLGDIIDFFTKKLYIKQFLIYITNGNCGCETRRILFNKWVQIPYFIFKIKNATKEEIKNIKKISSPKEKQVFTYKDELKKIFMESKKKAQAEIASGKENPYAKNILEIDKKLDKAVNEWTEKESKNFIHDNLLYQSLLVRTSPLPKNKYDTVYTTENGKPLNKNDNQPNNTQQTQQPISAKHIRGGCGCSKNKK